MAARGILPLAVTVALFLAMAGAGGVLYDGFLSPQVFLNLLIDNAFLCIAAVGMTFVILTGGIDLSVGAVLALTTMVSATLVERHGVHPAVAIPMVLVLGAAFGTLQGFLVQRFKLQAFIVTLGGNVPRARPVLPHQHRVDQHPSPVYAAIAQARVPLGADASLSSAPSSRSLVVAAGDASCACDAVRTNGLRHRQQRIVRDADGTARRLDADPRLRAERILRGACGRRDDVLYAFGIQPPCRRGSSWMPLPPW